MNQYLDSASSLINGINSLSEKIRLVGFIKWIITLLVFAAIALSIYEYLFSSSFYYDKIDRKLIIIEDVIRISNSDSTLVEEANKHLLEILEALDAPERHSIQNISINSYISESTLNYFVKIIAALLLPILAFIGSYKEGDLTNLIIGAIVISVLSIAISLIIPIIYSIWLHLLIIPMLQYLALLPFMRNSN